MWEITDDELVRLKCQQLFVPLIYSEIVGRILDKWPNAEEKLREFGRRIANGILTIWKPKNVSSVKSIASECYLYLLKQKPPIKVEKDGMTLVLKDENCILCWEVQTQGKLHYCAPYGSLLETFVNYCRENKNPKLPKIWVETTKSKAMGDNYCEHVIHIIED
ncbi:MAG: hypothetical protein ACTSPY_15830 [Candidatus Helarchaeota archaeon]